MATEPQQSPQSPWEKLTDLADPLAQGGPTAGGENGSSSPIQTVTEIVPPIVTPRGPGRPRKTPEQQVVQNVSGYAWRKPQYFKSFLDRFVSTSENLRVEKRDEIGHLHFIGAFTLHDIDKYDHIEEFLLTLVPTYNYGEYEVSLTNANGQVTKSGTYRIADPNRWRPRPADPSEKLLEKLERLEADLVKARTGTGNDNSTTLLMLEMGRIRSEITHANAAPPPMPMMSFPPPEPAVSPTEIVKAVTEAVKALQPAPQPVIQPAQGFTLEKLITLLPTIKEFIGMLVKPTTDMVEAIGAEMQEMRKEQRDRDRDRDRNKQGSGLAELLGEMKLLREAADTFRPAATGGETFAGVLKELLTDIPGKINAIGKLVADVRAQEAHQLPATQPIPRLAPPAPATPVQQALPAPTAPAPPPAPEPPPPPPFDPKFIEAVRQMALAKDNADRIGMTIGAITILGEQPYWKKFTDHLATLAKAAKTDPKEKSKLMALFKTFLDDLPDTPALKDVFPAAMVEPIYNAFVEHADKVIALIAG